MEKQEELEGKIINREINGKREGKGKDRKEGFVLKDFAERCFAVSVSSPPPLIQRHVERYAVKHLLAYSKLAWPRCRRSILLPREMQRRSIGFDGSHCPDSSTAVWILGMPPDLISGRSSGTGSARPSANQINRWQIDWAERTSEPPRLPRWYNVAIVSLRSIAELDGIWWRFCAVNEERFRKTQSRCLHSFRESASSQLYHPGHVIRKIDLNNRSRVNPSFLIERTGRSFLPSINCNRRAISQFSQNLTRHSPARHFIYSLHLFRCANSFSCENF